MASSWDESTLKKLDNKSGNEKYPQGRANSLDYYIDLEIIKEDSRKIFIFWEIVLSNFINCKTINQKLLIIVLIFFNNNKFIPQRN